MLDEKSFLIPRGSSSSSEEESKVPDLNIEVEAEADVSNGKLPLETGCEEEGEGSKTTKVTDVEEGHGLSQAEFEKLSMCLTNVADHQLDQPDPENLIIPIGRDMTINCLLRCSRGDYGAIASLNSNFRSLIKSGEIYKLRQMHGVVEHWVYFSCNLVDWLGFDPARRRWMRLPRVKVPAMDYNDCFICSDKESLGVGTNLLVFGRETMSYVVYKYSLLTNSWSLGVGMRFPRCLFGSASLGNIAIIAGGSDSRANFLSSAEMYDAEKQTWETLPEMIKARKMCSGVFMDGKFYVIGGIGIELKELTCGEEFDLATKTWTEIPNMSPINFVGSEGGRRIAAEAPPLVAVVNNELYAAEYNESVLKKYNKRTMIWETLGQLPERAGSMNGWGLAFKACGDRLVVIGGSKGRGEGIIEINSWVPNGRPLRWESLGIKYLGGFVYNCAVMGC